MEIAALYNIGYGLYVLSAREGEKDNGCILNTVMQVTDTPNRIVITVNKRTYTHDMIMRTKEFNVSVLTTETPFQVFGDFGFQSGREVDKFSSYPDAVRSDNGILYLPKYINSYISGKVISTMDLGTHTLFFADVTDAKILSNVESVTYAYYHKNIKPAPKKTEKQGYRCNICGYIYEGETLPEDYVCPICNHGASDFTKI